MDDFLKKLRTKISKSKLNLGVKSDAKDQFVDEIVKMVQEQLATSNPKVHSGRSPDGRYHLVTKSKPGGRGVIAHKSGATIMTESASQAVDLNNPMKG